MKNNYLFTRSTQPLALTPLLVGAVVGAGQSAKAETITGSTNFAAAGSYSFSIAQPGFSDSFSVYLNSGGFDIVEKTGSVSVTGTDSTGSLVSFTGVISPGDTVGSATVFDTTSAVANTSTSSTPVDNLFGFELNENSGATPRYGWVDIVASEDLSYNESAPKISWAYDTTGAPITTDSLTPTPEPAPVALGAVGLLLAGVRGLRRRRQLKLDD